VKVQKISPQLRDIHVPLPLQDLQLWCVWAFEEHVDEPKPRKVPHYSAGGRRHGRQGCPADREKLTTFAVARDAAARGGMDGVGFALMADAGVIALDFDKCVTDGKVDRSVLDLVVGTYAEYSPSGTGIRAFFFGASDVLGNPKSLATADQFGVEIFSSTGFVTVTGNVLDHVDLINGRDHIEPLPASVIEFCAKRFSASTAPAALDGDFTIGREPRLNLTVERMVELLGALDPDMGRDDWIRVGIALHHESDGDDTGFDIWDDWSAGGATYPSTEGLRVQWDSFRGATPGKRSITMASVIDMTKKLELCLNLDAASYAQRADDIISKLPKADGVRTPDGFAGKFPVYSACDAAGRQSGEWFIKGVVPKAGLIVLYGASGTGKSFVAFDLMASVARGVEWRGYRVKKSKVVFVVAEGSGGVGKRIKAYCQHNKIAADDLAIGIILSVPNVLDTDDIAELVVSVKACGADIVVIDTFAQVTSGANENSGEDMGRALRNLDLIREATGATIMIVHHAGKDLARGLRGWSGIRAAADAEIEVSGSGDNRLVKVTKMKDGDDNIQLGFRLSTLIVGVDGDGDSETSCVVEYIAACSSKKANAPGRSGANQRRVMDRARACGAETPRGASMETVIDQSINAVPYDPAASAGSKVPRDQRRSHVVRALGALSDKGLLVVVGDRVYFPEFQPGRNFPIETTAGSASASSGFNSSNEVK
jgi:hypothetical protein